jgi:hypothetical protein
MKLSSQWFIEGSLDVEYKQYIALAYLQQVKRSFSQTRLYPDFAELIAHYRELEDYRRVKDDMEGRFPQEVVSISLDPARIDYRSTVPEDPTLRDIDEIVEFSLPRFKQELETGRAIYEFLEGSLLMEPVGLMPIYKKEGYLLLRLLPDVETRVYQFEASFIYTNEERLGGLRTQYVTSFSYSLATTYSNMKTELVRQRRELPNPATFVAEAQLAVPLEETLLPITRRKLLRNLLAEG